MIAIHQSQFLPWIPYIAKILHTKKFVVLDSVQFQKNGFQNRNMLKTPQGAQYLTIPIKQKLEQKISEAKILNPQIHLKKALKTIKQNYLNAPYFAKVYEKIAPCFESAHSVMPSVAKHLDSNNRDVSHSLNMTDSLFSLNHSMLLSILELLKSECEIILQSELKNISGQKQELVNSIIKACGDLPYISGKGGGAICDSV